VTSGPRVELGEIERSLDVLKRLDEEGFTLTPQEDGSISGELLVPEDELERGYERVVSILKSLSDTVSLPGNSAY